MSLLDDVSIVVTPNGYKAGTLFAVKPTIAYGSELVVNGDFSQGNTGWTIEAVWTISGGAAHGNGASGSSQELKQAILEVGKTYEFSYEIRNRVSGSVELLNSGLGSTSSNEVYKSIGIATSTELRFRPSSFNGDIYNVSVREFTGADMDVTRATAATRVDEDGLVNYAEVVGDELVTNGDFELNSDWNNFGTPTTSEQSTEQSHTGTYSWKIIADATQEGIFSPNNFSLTSGLQYTVSLWIYSVSGDSIKSGLNNTNVSVFTERTVIAGQWTNITYEATATSTGASYISILSQNSLNFYVDNVSVKEVTRDNVPRIDYTGGGCPHILSEPQRTNLVTYSENYSESGYGWNYTSDALELIELNSIVSPDGTQNADKIAKTATRVYANAHSPQNIVSNQLYSWSMFIKEGTHSIGYLSLTQGDTEYKSYFDLNNEISGMLSGSATTKLEDFGNGWYKCTLSNISSTTDLSVRFDFGMSYSTTNANWPSASEGNGLYMYYWGAQLEESYATSYIPTSGSSVTRNQDIFTRDGIGSLINSTEGVLFVEMAKHNGNTVAPVISLNNGTSSQTVALYYFSTDEIAFDVISSSPNVSGVSSSYNTDNFNKIALKYKSGDIALWVNGVEVLTKTNTISLTGLNKISFDYGNGTYSFFGKVKQLQVYNTALTDAQLTSLTS